MTIASKVFKERRRKLAELLPGRSIILYNGPERFRNIPTYPYPFRGSSTFIYFCGVLPPRTVLFLSDEREVVFVAESDEKDAIWHGALPSREELAAQAGIDEVKRRQELSDFLDNVPRGSIRTLPFSDKWLNEALKRILGRTPNIEGVDRELALAVTQLRLIQDDAALSEIRSACNATASAQLAAMKATNSKKTDFEIQAVVESEFISQGLRCSFPSIVTTHGEVLHGTASGRKLSKSDLLLVDVGAESREGYAGDITRTWPVSGKFSARQRDVYQVVLDAQTKAIEAIAPGVRYRDVHIAAAFSLAEGLSQLGILNGTIEGLVESGAYTLFFPHGIGHLLGLDVHDMENFGDLAGYPEGRERSSAPGLRYLRLDRDLQAGMVVTVEPGFYWIPAILENDKYTEPYGNSIVKSKLESFRSIRGIRIEDDVLVTDSGCEALTKNAPSEISEIEKVVGAK